METKYNVTLYLNDGKGKTEVLKATVDFEHNPETYGNGFYMGIKAPFEAFGYQGYDIRYDREFDKEYPIPYIVRFFCNRFTGKNGSWKLIGIRVHEAE